MAEDDKIEIRMAVLETKQAAKDLAHETARVELLRRIEKLEGTLVWVVRTVFVIVIGAVLAGVGIVR